MTANNTEQDASFFRIKNVSVANAIFLMALLVMITTGLIEKYFSKIDIVPSVDFIFQAPFYETPKNLIVWRPDYIGYDNIQQWELQIDTRAKVYAQIVSYDRQRQGKELIQYRNKISEKDYETKLGLIEISENIKLNSSVFYDSQTKKEYKVYWIFRVGRRYAHGDIEAKLLAVPAFFLRRNNAELILFKIDCSNSCKKSLTRELEDSLLSYLSLFFEGITVSYKKNRN